MLKIVIVNSMNAEITYSLSVNVTTNQTSFLANCIIDIIKSENLNKAAVLLTANNKDADVESDPINRLMYENIPVVIKDHLNETYENDSEENNLYAIINFDTCESLSNFNYNTINYKIKYLMIYSADPNDCDPDWSGIGMYVNQHDVVFLFKDVKEFHFYTLLPEVDKDTCEMKKEMELTKINACNNGKMEHRTVFPEKGYTDMKGCELKIGLASLYPFSMFENKFSYKDNDVIAKANGSDIAILEIIAEYINACLEYHFIYRSEENPYIQSDFLKLVLNGRLDALAGGLYRIYGDIVEYSGIYQRQGVIWVYTAEREHRNWINFISKLHGIYWFFLFYGFYCVVWNFIRYFDGSTVSISKTILHAWGALIGASSLQEARSLKQCIVNLSYLILSIYLSCYIGIHMFSFLTINSPPEFFRTTEEVYESGRVAYLNSPTKYFIQDPKYVNFANKSEDCDSFVDCEEKTLANKGMTLVIDGLFYPYQLATTINYEARVLRTTENILTVYHEMIIRKGHPITKKFQKVIERLFEAGICEKLYLEAIGISVVARAKAANENMMHNSYACLTGCSITLNQVAGVFYLWLFGCFASCCVFVLELLLKRQLPLRTVQPRHLKLYERDTYENFSGRSLMSYSNNSKLRF
ncbi:hypothetical protein NE865_15147 [Phthorimaea operculella]|nr:hypothetical protein NE865_15147 [Phthorimaea operculella]